MFSNDVDPERSKQAKDAGALFLLGKPCIAGEINAALTRALEQIKADKVRESLGALVAQLPNLKVGDRLEYRGQHDVVKHVIFRHGELLVQLNETPGVLQASSLRRI
jgi:hypothetical protein